jgi:hypothetical protein
MQTILMRFSMKLGPIYVYNLYNPIDLQPSTMPFLRSTIPLRGPQSWAFFFWKRDSTRKPAKQTINPSTTCPKNAKSRATGLHDWSNTSHDPSTERPSTLRETVVECSCCSCRAFAAQNARCSMLNCELCVFSRVESDGATSLNDVDVGGVVVAIALVAHQRQSRSQLCHCVHGLSQSHQKHQHRSCRCRCARCQLTNARCSSRRCMTCQLRCRARLGRQLRRRWVRFDLVQIFFFLRQKNFRVQ